MKSCFNTEYKCLHSLEIGVCIKEKKKKKKKKNYKPTLSRFCVKDSINGIYICLILYYS